MRNKWTLLIIILVFSILLIININISKNQQKEFIMNHQTHLQATYLMQNDDLQTAVQLKQYLYNSEPHNDVHSQDLGLIYAMMEDWEEAIKYYQEAIQLNPFLVYQEHFLLNYSKIYLFNDQLEESIVVIDYIINNTKNVPVIEEANVLKDYIKDQIDGEI